MLLNQYKMEVTSPPIELLGNNICMFFFRDSVSNKEVPWSVPWATPSVNRIQISRKWYNHYGKYFHRNLPFTGRCNVYNSKVFLIPTNSDILSLQLPNPISEKIPYTCYEYPITNIYSDNIMARSFLQCSSIAFKS